MSCGGRSNVAAKRGKIARVAIECIRHQRLELAVRSNCLDTLLLQHCVKGVDVGVDL